MIPLPKDNLTKADVQDKLKEIFSHYTGDRQELIPILQETQEKFHYLPAAAMREILNSCIYRKAWFMGSAPFTPSSS
jgi:NADH:ubiquinone oxidoreductase subunit E